MNDDEPAIAALERISTHVPGLDAVLRGGFFRAGVYIVQGAPGAGKTTLATQAAFGHARAGGKAIYLTLLSESHARMMQHMREQRYFEPAYVGDRIHFLSGFRELESGQLRGVVGLLRSEVTRQRATFLVLDGLVVAADHATTNEEVKRFVHEVQSLAILTGCTVLLLTSSDGRARHAEQTMVDGIIGLEDVPRGGHAERLLRVTKFRGSDVLRGEHVFCITDDGITVYPRLETLATREPPEEPPVAVVPSGVAALDAMFHDRGVPAASATLALGAAGSGKTTLALAFAGAADAAGGSVLFSFGETPQRLRARAAAMSLPADRIELRWFPSSGWVVDEVAHELLHTLRVRHAKRAVVDGLDALMALPAFAARGRPFLAALTLELRRLGVTSLFTVEAAGEGEREVGFDVARAYGAFDNVIRLDSEEAGNALPWRLTIAKARQAAWRREPARYACAHDGLRFAAVGARGS